MLSAFASSTSSPSSSFAVVSIVQVSASLGRFSSIMTPLCKELLLGVYMKQRPGDGSSAEAVPYFEAVQELREESRQLQQNMRCWRDKRLNMEGAEARRVLLLERSGDHPVPLLLPLPLLLLSLMLMSSDSQQVEANPRLPGLPNMEEPRRSPYKATQCHLVRHCRHRPRRRGLVIIWQKSVRSMGVASGIAGASFPLLEAPEGREGERVYRERRREVAAALLDAPPCDRRSERVYRLR